MKTGDKVIFNTTNMGLSKNNGKEAIILEIITKPDNQHIESVLPLYKLDLKDDGEFIEAFAMEISAVCHTWI